MASKSTCHPLLQIDTNLQSFIFPSSKSITMTRVIHSITHTSLLIISILVSSCKNLISFSPFDVDISSKYLNQKNIETLQSTPFAPIDSLLFVVISDSHSSYDELEKAISAINSMPGISFVVCCGDITDCGTVDEFEWYWDIAGNSDVPVFTLIGNHDYLSNGKLVYNRMFGPTNFSLDYGGYNFVFFDDVIWENDNRNPDFEWLDNQLQTSDKNILFAHIPLWSDEMEGERGEIMDSVITRNNALIVINGHDHRNEDTIRNGIPYYVLCDIADRQMALVTLTGSKSTYQLIRF